MPGSRQSGSWKEKAMTLELTADAGSLQNSRPAFEIERIDSFTWLVAGGP